VKRTFHEVYLSDKIEALLPKWWRDALFNSMEKRGYILNL